MSTSTPWRRGALNTRMMDQLIEAGPEKIGVDFFREDEQSFSRGRHAVSARAQISASIWPRLRATASPEKMLSAVWDPWATLQLHIAELDNTDIYTLRRIVPEDRGRKMGKVMKLGIVGCGPHRWQTGESGAAGRTQDRRRRRPRTRAG